MMLMEGMVMELTNGERQHEAHDAVSTSKHTKENTHNLLSPMTHTMEGIDKVSGAGSLRDVTWWL